METNSESEQVQKSSNNNLFLKISVVFVSILITWAIVELVFFNILISQDKKFQEKCKYFDPNQLSATYGFSLVNYFYPPSISVFHCNEEWEYTYHINNFGLRDEKEEAVQKDILAVGDSFTFGFGVKDNESFPALLNANNAGIWGAPFSVQINSFKRNVELYKPKIVVWSLYPSHVVTMTRSEWAGDCPGSKTYFKGDEPVANTASWFLNTSNFGKYLMKQKKFASVSSDKNGMHVSTNCYETKEIMIYDKNLENNKYTDNPESNKSFAEDRDKIYSQIKSYMDEAKKISDEKDVEMYFVIIPSRLNLKLKNGEYNANYEGADIDADLPLNTFKGIITGAGFEENKIIDLSKYFLETGEWQKYYFEKDAHWNTDGHKFVSEIIKQKINGTE